MEAESKVVRPSTSTKVHQNIDYCSDCYRAFDIKNIIRFILQSYHPVLIVRLTIKHGDITTNWAATTKMNDAPFCNYTTSIFHDNVLVSFLSWLADKVNTDITRLINGLDNIVTCPTSIQTRSPAHAIFIDFDLMKLNNVGHAIQNMRDQLTEKTSCPMLSRYLSCLHVVEKSIDDVLTWYVQKYFYNLDNIPNSDYDTYARFQTLRKKIRNSLVISETDAISSQGEYLVDILFYSRQSNGKTEQKQTPADLIYLLKNSIMQFDDESLYIVRSYDSQTTKHTFYIVYKDIHDITYDKLYTSLVLLRDILHRLRINNIVMHDIHLRCSPLSSSKIVYMVKYIFLDSHIKVIITAPRKCCFPNMVCFNN